jgi:hypothetical protein
LFRLEDEMTCNHSFVSAVSEILRRGRWAVVGTTALAMLLPSSTFAMDSTPRQPFDPAGRVLPLPPVHYLDSMRWMDWKPGTPVFNVDTLLLPDSTQPGILRLPSDYERGLPHVS